MKKKKVAFSITLVSGSHKKKVTDVGAEIKKMFESEEHKLTCHRHTEVRPDNSVGLLDYILGIGVVLGKKVPPDIMGKVTIAVLHHAKMGYLHCSQVIKLNSIDRELLNNPSSELLTPRDILNLPRGLQLKSKLYFSLEAKIHDGNDVFFSGKNRKVHEGDYIILTEDGIYRWEYSYNRKNIGFWARHPKYKKNLTSKTRFIPSVCRFTPMTSKEFEVLFTENPDLFLNLMHRIHQQVQNQKGEITRVHSHNTQEIGEIWNIISKLVYS